MRYSRFVIRNFKGIRELTIDLGRPPRSNVLALVGLNESGKTTILEAMHWLHDPEGYDLTSLIPKGELMNFNGEISVSAEVAFTSEDEADISRLLARKTHFVITEPIDRIQVTRIYRYENSSLVDKKYHLDVSITGQTRKMKEPRTLSPDDARHERYYLPAKEYILGCLLPPIIYYKDFLFNFPDKLYLEIKPPHLMNPEDLFYKEVIQDVMDSMEKNLNPDTHLVKRYLSRKDSTRRAMASCLDKLGSKITTEVLIAWQDLLKYSETAMSITLGQTLEEDERGYYIQVQVKEGDQTYLIRERSLGFRWFFSFVLFTHFRAFRSKRKGHALFLLDEPASNLHQTAQAKVLLAFDQFPGKQDVIYATHSHHMINPKWLAGTFVVKNEAKEYSDVDVAYNSHVTDIKADRYFHFVAQHPADKDYYRPILDALDYQPSQLEFVPELVMLEGKNDFYTLKYMSEMGLVQSSVGQYLYPGTGKDKLDYIVGLYIGWGRNFIVLLDDDSGGRETYGRLADEFGPLVANRVFRLVHVDRGWKGFTMERVFLSSDHLKVIKTLYPDQKEFDKSRFNTALQDAYINGYKLRLHLNTIKRFQKIFTFIESKLAENREGVPIDVDDSESC